MELEITYLPIDELVPYAGNAKKHPKEQIDQIAESISLFGNCDPIGVWENQDGAPEIVEGHGRVLALRQLGIDTAPVIFLNHLTDEQRRAYTHVHNQTTLSSGFDVDALIEDIDNLNMDWASLGFEEYLPSYDEEPVTEDEVPEDAEPRCKAGDVWSLGPHRLMCGSATDAEDMRRLAGGRTADLLLTDPPYGVSYIGKTKRHLTIDNDTMTDAELRDFMVDSMSNAMELLEAGASFYIFHADSKGYEVRDACKRCGMEVRQCLVWVKDVLVLGRQDYQWQHEPCLYGWKAGDSHRWYSDRKQTTVLEFQRPTASREHPTMKPVALMAYLVGNSTERGDTVLDCFGGSGTTLIACEQLGRSCLMMEVDPAYCDIIIERWERMSGQQAVLAVD